jgi:hypothetical protein
MKDEKKGENRGEKLKAIGEKLKVEMGQGIEPRRHGGNRGNAES